MLMVVPQANPKILVQLAHPPHHLVARHDDLQHHSALMHSHNIHAFTYTLPISNLSKTHTHKLAELLSDPGVVHAELDQRVYLTQQPPPQLLPNDPQLGLQYGLSNIKAPYAWVNTTGSAAVRVCVLDTGGMVWVGLVFVGGWRRATLTTAATSTSLAWLSTQNYIQPALMYAPHAHHPPAHHLCKPPAHTTHTTLLHAPQE